MNVELITIVIPLLLQRDFQNQQSTNGIQGLICIIMLKVVSLRPSARMRRRVTVLVLSVCLSVCLSVTT